VALGVPVFWQPGETTPGFTIRNSPGGREMRIDAIGDPWQPEDVDGLSGVEWLHVAPLARSDFPPETLAALARGRRLSLDGQGLVRPPRTGPLRLDTDFDRALLEHVSVLKLSEDEARALVGTLDEAALGELGVPEVVVTLDVRGSLVLAHGRLHEVRASPVTAPDPTGAGDAFAAAYIDARSGGHAPVTAARRATALVGGLLSGRVR
jgi:sugar/nucleoside kinase (ribokinase family)